jgi:hypothetical protein
VIISVTDAHIEACRKTTDCPVTRAIEEALAGHSVYVGPRYAQVDGAPVHLPDEVIEWCFEWDCGRVGDPFTFEFDPSKRPEHDIPFVYTKAGAA